MLCPGRTTIVCRWSWPGGTSSSSAGGGGGGGGGGSVPSGSTGPMPAGGGWVATLPVRVQRGVEGSGGGGDGAVAGLPGVQGSPEGRRRRGGEAEERRRCERGSESEGQI